MEKLKCTIYAPITEYSFYGRKSRQFIKNIIKTRQDFDVRVVEYRTKNVKQGYIDKDILLYIGSPWENTDVCFFFGNPILYQQYGKIANIAFVDTGDIINAEDLKLFITRCNAMSLVLVCSNYAKTTLKELTYKENGKEMSIQVPIMVTTEYATINELNIQSAPSLLDSVSTPQNFLLEGRWDVDNDVVFGGKNKDNISYMISNFLDTFKDIENAPGLIVHVHGDLASTVDVCKLNNRINNIKKTIEYQHHLPNIYLLNGELVDEQIWTLYNDPKVIALIRVPQRCDSIESELNFMSVGKPIIYSSFGAQTEVLNHKGNIAVNCQIKELKMDSIEGHGPKLADAYGVDLRLAMYEVFYHYESNRNAALKFAMSFFESNNSGRVFSIFNNILNQLIPMTIESTETPTPIPSSLPEEQESPTQQPKQVKKKVTIKKKE